SASSGPRRRRRRLEISRRRPKSPGRPTTIPLSKTRSTALHSGHGALAHQFDNLEQQQEVASLGMWLFLVTEVLFFGGLFLVYSVYRGWFPRAFAASSHELIVWAGTLNTVVLLTSSLTMVLAVSAAQTGHRRALIALLLATMALGC